MIPNDDSYNSIYLLESNTATVCTHILYKTCYIISISILLVKCYSN